MTTSVTTTNAAAPNTTTAVTPPSNTSNTTTAGLSSVTSSISSAADNQGFSAQVSAWVASVVDTIRSCLARLPCIGSWFEKSPVPTPQPLPQQATTQWTDAELLGMIRGQFVAAGGTTTAAAPAADTVAYTVSLFSQIQSHAVKMDAFEGVLAAVNSTDDIARQFYNALPEGTGVVEASRSTFRRHIWEANGRVTVVGGVDQGANFGDHIIGSAPRGPLAQQAAQNLRAALAAAVTTTASTTAATTSAATTTSTTVVNSRLADAGFLNGIRNILAAADAAGTTVGAPDIALIVNMFGQIQAPVTKMDALQIILTAARSTDAIARQCYDSLPEGIVGTAGASQSSIRHQIWEANGRVSVVGGVDQGLNFAPHILGTAMRGVLVQTAVQNLRTVLAA